MLRILLCILMSSIQTIIIIAAQKNDFRANQPLTDAEFKQAMDTLLKTNDVIAQSTLVVRQYKEAYEKQQQAAQLTQQAIAQAQKIKSQLNSLKW